MTDDLEEKEIYCKECNGYICSTSIYDEGPDLIPCPFQRDPCGECTGKPKSTQLSSPWRATRNGLESQEER